MEALTSKPVVSEPVVAESGVLEPVVVEVLDSHGRVHVRQRLALPADRRSFTVGRSAAADVMLDDPFVAALHVTFDVTPEGLFRATDLGSVNGIVVKAKRHRHAQGLELPDGLVQVGRTHLRLRTVREVLAVEKPDHAAGDARAGRIAVSGALACALFIGYYSWLTAPWDPATAIAIRVMMVLPVAGLWIAVWALLSRVIMGEWRWMMHAAILFGVVAGVLALDSVLDLAWFAFALPQSPWRDSLLLIAAAALALFWHLTEASTMKQRRAALVAVLLPAVAVGTTTWANARGQNRNVNFIGPGVKLFPSVLRLREGGTLDAYFTEAARLRDSADQKRKAMPGEEGDETADEE
jgi:hypothetical protein